MSQQFCLKWNNHTTNMLQVFENLLTTEALVDVTLACDGLSLKAHKMVLSACSPFFQSLFLENPCKHPIVIMKDMRYCDLKAIIDFMYRGEVNVSHDQLSALLKTAETLKVKGLAEVTGENKQASGIVQHEIIQQNACTPTPVPPSAQRTDTPPLQGKRKRGRPRKRSLSDSNRSDDEGVPPKIKETNSDIEELSGDASMEATSDNRSSGGPISCNSQSQVPIHSSNNVNTFSKSHLSTSQDPQGEEPASGDENEFEVEPSKLLEQTLTTENVPSNSHNSTGPITLPSVSGLEISRRSMSSTDSGSQALVPVSIPSDSLGSNIQGPDSPQDVKPQILSFDDPPISPVAGTSHGSDRSLMMYMDQSGVASIPGPSNFQDNSALVPHDSQPQGKRSQKQGRSKSLSQVRSVEQISSLLEHEIKEETDSNDVEVITELKGIRDQSSEDEVAYGSNSKQTGKKRSSNKNNVTRMGKKTMRDPMISIEKRQSTETTTSPEFIIRSRSDFNKAMVQWSIKNEAKKRAKSQEKRKKLDSTVSIAPFVKQGPSQSIECVRNLEQTASLKKARMEKQYSNQADVLMKLMTKIKESGSQISKHETKSNYSTKQTGKNKISNKDKVKIKTYSGFKSRTSRDSRSLGSSQKSKTTSLEENMSPDLAIIGSDSDINIVQEVQSEPEINDGESVSGIQGRKTTKKILKKLKRKTENRKKKFEVKRKTYLKYQKRKNPDSIDQGYKENRETTSTQANSSPETMINDGNDSTKIENQSKKDEIKKKTYKRKKKTNLDPIVKLQSIAKTNLDPIVKLQSIAKTSQGYNFLNPIVKLERAIINFGASTSHGGSINIGTSASNGHSINVGASTSNGDNINIDSVLSSVQSPIPGLGISLDQTIKEKNYFNKDAPETQNSDVQISRNDGENVSGGIDPSCCQSFINKKKSLSKFKCKNCDFTTAHENFFQSHTCKQADQYPFHCPCCEYTSRGYSFLKKHWQTKHPEMGDFYSQDQMLRTHEKDYYES